MGLVLCHNSNIIITNYYYLLVLVPFEGVRIIQNILYSKISLLYNEREKMMGVMTCRHFFKITNFVLQINNDFFGP